MMSKLNISREYSSPNFDPRPEGIKIDSLVIHYTDMSNAKEALELLCDPAAKVSAHYLIDKDGKVYQLVDDHNRAWHAGMSYWDGREKVNDFSIGIELDNPGHRLGYTEFPQEQMRSLIKLAREISIIHPIRMSNVVAHSDIAPSRKKDPGELFNWQLLADKGVGIHANANIEDNDILFRFGDHGVEVLQLQNRLKDYGYLTYPTGVIDEHTADVIKAFKRHFYQDVIDAVWDKKADLILEKLLVLSYKKMQLNAAGKSL